MASTATAVLFLSLFFFFFFSMQEATVEKNQSIIELGSWLSPKGRNTSWTSSSGRFAFGFYPHGGNKGFAVGIWLVSPPSPSNHNSTTVVWTANRDDPPFSSNSILNLTSQGLLLQNGGDNGDQYLTILDSDSDSKTVVAWGCMNDNGNFVLYDEYTNVVWQSFDYPTNTILGGQNITYIALLKIPSTLPITLPPLPPPTSNNTYLFNPIILADNKTHLIIILSFNLGTISLIFLVFEVFVFITYRRQLRRYTTLSQSEQNLGFTQEYSLRAFSYDELVKSTEDFAEEIGRGSFGAVYAGTILVGESNKRIAVKRLERINNVDDDGEREFRAEITTIARTHHRNLVKLIGFCIDGSKKLLVYEYLSNGSLASLLFEGGLRLCSKEKMKIALDVARGLLYLHEECEVRIIHCNIKPRNILMDEAWNAKITDFGLARLLKRECSRMKIEGEDNKSGYLAPEWHNDSSVSVKADIYSFGIVLLEIVCRKSNVYINVSSAGETLLSNWAYQCFASGQLNKLNDHEEDVDWKVVERMVKVGLWCVQDHPSLRPSIKNVILMLEGLKDIPVPPPSPAARLVEI